MNMKKVISGMAVLFVLAAVPVAAAEQGNTTEIQILASSDIHGKMLPYDYILDEESTSGSLAQISTLIKELRTENTIVIDNGDTIQGNSAEFFWEDDIHPMILGFNSIGYDIWVAGNHEFNAGIETLKKEGGQFGQAFLCGNVYDQDGEAIADGYTIIEKGGVKVGIIGMVTPNIRRWDAENLKEYTVTDPVEETKKIIDEIRDEVDILVAAEHMGEENENDLKNSGVNDLAYACPELDVIIAGHEHKQIAGTEVNGVLIVENADSGKSLAQVVLTVEKEENGEYSVTDIKSESYDVGNYAPDEEIIELLADQDTRAKEDAHTVIGTLKNGPLVPENEITGIPQAKLEETALIDLINEVMLYYSGADISATALLTDSANLDSGDIRKCDISSVYKFADTLYKLEMTGAQLKKWMEWSASYYNTYHEGDLTISFNPDMEGYQYDMFSGVRYEIDISKEPGHRIENLTRMDGTEIRDDDIFTVAVDNYRATSQLLIYGEVYEEGVDELPVVLEKDVRSELGDIRGMIADYIMNVNNGELEVPPLTGNWKITGNDWDEELHKQAVSLLNSGKLTVKDSESGRNINIVSITVEDLK